MIGADVVMNHAPFGVQVRLDPAAQVHYTRPVWPAESGRTGTGRESYVERIEEWRGSGAPAPDGGGGA
jgi:hypothetical protein